VAYFAGSAESSAPSCEFYRRHNCRDEKSRIREIRQAVPATHDQAVIQASVLMVQAPVRLIQDLKRDTELCDERIEELTNPIRTFAIFDSLVLAML
jgi:hypothetical protein